jgi:hypothetical protein
MTINVDLIADASPVTVTGVFVSHPILQKKVQPRTVCKMADDNLAWERTSISVLVPFEGDEWTYSGATAVN